MKSNYLIFVEPNNVQNFIQLTCEREKFVDTLLEEELLTSTDEFKLVNWTIFEDNVLIK